MKAHNRLNESLERRIVSGRSTRSGSVGHALSFV